MHSPTNQIYWRRQRGRPADFYAKLETSASGRGSPWAARSRKTARRAVPKSRWPYHRAGGAPPQAEAMDGKEEIRVVEEEPSWTGGSLESLDVIDKVPDESVKLATD